VRKWEELGAEGRDRMSEEQQKAREAALRPLCRLSSVTQDITTWGQSPRLLDHSRLEAGQPSFGEGQWLDAGHQTSGHKAGGISRGRTGPPSSVEWLA